LILFRSPDLFRYYWLNGKFKDVQAVDDRFQILPLLRTMAHAAHFHLLALSQHDVRLFRGTQHRLETVPANGLPKNLEVWLHNRQPDHVRENWSTAGPSVGAMRGVVSGSSAEREREGENLYHFLKDVDKCVIHHLRRDTAPLLLAGVDYELAIYRRVNSYKPTLRETVNGSPDGVPERTLHERAMDVVKSTFSEPLRQTLGNIHEFHGTARSSTDPRTVIQGAFEGRVSDLAIAANAEFWGAWNAETHEVEEDGRDELLNAAALQTIQHRGRAFVLDPEDMPVKAPAAAVFRF
jgi:hypothetical protein